MKVAAILLLVFVLSKLLIVPVINYFQIDSLNEPLLKSYRSDEASFLKTFYLMEKGMGYYQSFKIARENMSDGNLLQKDIFTWRMPTIFYFWNFCCDTGREILSYFIFCCFLSSFLIYMMFEKIIGKWAILSPVMLLPYLYDTFLYKSAFLFIEWWGLFFFIIGLYGLSNNFSKLSTVGFLLAILTRELFIIPVFTMFMYSLIKKQNLKTFLVPLLGTIFLYGMHAVMVSNLVEDTASKTRLIERFRGYSFENLQNMISFSMRQFVVGGLKSHYLVLLLGFGSLVYGTFNTKVKILPFLLISILSFLIILPIISVKENDYWGIMFVPLILISLPSVLALRGK